MRLGICLVLLTVMFLTSIGCGGSPGHTAGVENTAIKSRLVKPAGQ
jgi:hypothetical protein